MRAKILAAALLLAAAPSASAQTAPSVEQRAAALVAQMTLEEKAAQLKDVAPAIPRLGIPAYGSERVSD